MIDYKECLSDRHLLPLDILRYRGKFPTVAKAIEYSIAQLIGEHVDCGHINADEPHNAQTLIKKDYYTDEKEFVRVAVRSYLKKEGLWIKKFD